MHGVFEVVGMRGSRVKCRNAWWPVWNEAIRGACVKSVVRVCDEGMHGARVE